MSARRTNLNSAASRRVRATFGKDSRDTEIVGIPSSEASVSTLTGSCSARTRDSTSTIALASIFKPAAHAEPSPTPEFAEGSITSGVRPLRRHPLLIDFLLELDDAVNERLGSRRAPWDEHVDRDNLVHALDNGVVVEDAPNRCAGAHGNHPF